MFARLIVETEPQVPAIMSVDDPNGALDELEALAEEARRFGQGAKRGRRSSPLPRLKVAVWRA